MQLNNCDILGFSGYSWTSALINLGTFGIPFYSLSHVGIVCQNLLWESTTKSTIPDYFTGKLETGSQAVRIDAKINSYHGKVYLYKWQGPPYDPYTFLKNTLHRPYDYLGAIRARDLTVIEKIVHRVDNYSALYCSEWVAAALPVPTPERCSPNTLMRYLLRTGWVLKPRRLK